MMADNPTYPISLAVNARNLPAISQHLTLLPKDGSISVTFSTKGETRSNKQNRLSHLLYSEISRQGQDDSFIRVKSLCKYHLGLPIIVRDEPELTHRFKLVLEPLTYEERIEAMQLLSLTSLLSMKQKAEYITAIYELYEPQGYRLPRPEDLYLPAIEGCNVPDATRH